MNLKFTLFLTLILSVGLCFPLFARENPYSNSPEILSARTAAIGGLHSALADDLITLFGNPAGFRSAGPQFSATEATIGAYGPVSSVFSGSVPSSYTAVQLLGPVSFGYVGKGFGFGVFDTVSIRYGTFGGTDTKIDENLIVAAGYAFRIPLPEGSNSTLDLGLLAKPFMTIRSTTTKDINEILGSYLDIANAASYRDGGVQRVTGIGVDLGILYSYGEKFSVGVVGRNFAVGKYKNYATYQDLLNGQASSAGYVLYALDLSAGIVWKPQTGRLGRHIQDLTLMLDYRDMLDFVIWPATAISPLLHVAGGLEFKLLEILSLRAGFYQCLPSAGVGLDLSLFTLNASVFGIELSDSPWGSPLFNTMLGVEFRY